MKHKASLGTGSVIYGDISDGYQAIADSLSRNVGVDPSWNVLDAGCSHGDVGQALECATRSGMDIASHPHYPEISVIHHDMKSVPWPYSDQEFDLAFIHSVIQLLTFEQGQAAVIELERVGRCNAVMDIPDVRFIDQYNRLRKEAGKAPHTGFSREWFSDRGYTVMDSLYLTFNYHLKFDAFYKK